MSTKVRAHCRLTGRPSAVGDDDNMPVIRSNDQVDGARRGSRPALLAEPPPVVRSRVAVGSPKYRGLGWQRPRGPAERKRPRDSGDGWPNYCDGGVRWSPRSLSEM